MSRRTERLAYLGAAFLVLAFGISGTYILGHKGGFNVPVETFTEAAYFTIATVSTVGYGDVYPVTDTARLFVIMLILSGVGVFIGGVITLSGEFVTSRIETLRGGVSLFERRLLNKHIILIGTNETNLSLAEDLKKNNKRFIMVTTNPDLAENLRYEGYRIYVADAASESSVKEFGFDKAKAVVIDLIDSSRTVYVLLVVISLVKDAKIIVVSPTKQTEKYIRNLSKGRAVIINPADIAARTVSEKLLPK